MVTEKRLGTMHLVRDKEELTMKDPLERSRSKQRCDVFSSFLTFDMIVPVIFTEEFPSTVTAETQG